MIVISSFFCSVAPNHLQVTLSGKTGLYQSRNQMEIAFQSIELNYNFGLAGVCSRKPTMKKHLRSMEPGKTNVKTPQRYFVKWDAAFPVEDFSKESDSCPFSLSVSGPSSAILKKPTGSYKKM